MASTSYSRILWDPFKVLDVYPNVSGSTCIGVNRSREKAGTRCGWRFASHQFDPSELAAAKRRLDAMSEMHPSEVTSAELHSLAQIALCRDYHQSQAYEVEARWRAKIQAYLREHGGRLANTRATRQLPSGGIARDNEALEREVRETRRALESSQANCAELTDKHDKLAAKHGKLEEEQVANARDLAVLRRQLMELQQASSERLEERKTEVERLRKQMEERDASFEKGMAASSRGIKGLKDSKARLDRLMTENTLEIVDLKAKVRDSAKEFDERAKRGEEEAADLRRRCAVGDGEIAHLKEATGSAEEKAMAIGREMESLRQGLRESNDRFEEKARLNERDMENLRQGLHQSNAQHEAFEAQSTQKSERLTEQLEALDERYKECRDENAVLVSRSQEQDRKIERLMRQMDGVKQELTKRDRYVEQLDKHMDAMRLDSAERGRHVGQLVEQMEGLKRELTEQEVRRLTGVRIGEAQLTWEQEQLSALQAPKAKRGLFAVFSRKPPRVLTRKTSKIMTTASAPYVQSAA